MKSEIIYDFPSESEGLLPSEDKVIIIQRLRNLGLIILANTVLFVLLTIPEWTKIIPFNYSFYLVIIILFISLLVIAYLKYKILRLDQRIYRLNRGVNVCTASQFYNYTIYSSLGSIDSLIDQNRNKKASEYLYKLSSILSRKMHRKNYDVITLSEELGIIKDYLDFELLRTNEHSFKNQFNFEIIVDQNLDTHNIYIPNELLQLYVEDAVWRLDLGEKNRRISIRINKKDKHLSCSIYDNGVLSEAASQFNKHNIARPRKDFIMELKWEFLMNRIKTFDKGEVRVEYLEHKHINKQAETRVDISILYE